MKRAGLFAALAVLLVSGVAWGFWELPELPPPQLFGNLLINRTSAANGVKPVVFSHWVHRRKHTCRVCHFELEFNMKANTTQITEKTNQAGLHCGAAGCHDGKVAFGHGKENCEKCHNGDITYGSDKFQMFAGGMPRTHFGDTIDWSAALIEGLISPQNYLTIKPSEGVGYKEDLLLEAEWASVPPAVFPHQAHIRWLDCNNCHPDIFNIKKKGTEHFTMLRILDGEFCGVCHLNASFPMHRCKACHPAMKSEKRY